MTQRRQARSAINGNCGRGRRRRSCRLPMAIIPGIVLLLSGSASSSWSQTASFLGQVVPLPGAVQDVTSPATGEMISAREQPFTVGDRVKKGEPLLVISNRYDLHDAAHISNVRWDILKQVIESRYAALEARI